MINYVILSQATTAIDIVDKASTASDRWLFLSALAIIIIGGSLVIRWLVSSLEAKDVAHVATIDAKDVAHSKEMTDMRMAHAAERSEWRTILEASKTQFLTAIMDQRKDFREELSNERHACAAERALDREARHATANAVNSLSLGLQALTAEKKDEKS